MCERERERNDKLVSRGFLGDTFTDVNPGSELMMLLMIIAKINSLLFLSPAGGCALVPGIVALAIVIQVIQK